MSKAEIKINERTAGWLTQDENGYHFIYDAAFLQSENPEAISLTLNFRIRKVIIKKIFPY